MKPHGPELRDRVISAIEEEGMSRRAAAARFKISDASAVRWVQARRQGRNGPFAQGGDRRSKLPEHRTWLLALVEEEPDLTLAAVGERLLAEHSVKADASMLSRFFGKCGISFKKNRSRLGAAAR
jgi:putative transposase